MAEPVSYTHLDVYKRQEEMRHLLNLSSDEMEALVEHREKLDAELEQLRELSLIHI